MNKISQRAALGAFPMSALAAAMLLAAGATQAQSLPTTVHGVVAGTVFTPPAGSVAGTTVSSVYQGATVCFDTNNNGVCDAGEPTATTAADGSFTLATRTLAPLVAQISTQTTNGGVAVTQRNVLRLAAEQITASTVSPALPVSVAVTPLSTEIARSMDADGLTFAAARTRLATRLGVTTAQVTSDTNKLPAGAARTAVLTESVILTNRFGLAARMVDRGDVSDVKTAQQDAMNVEGIPRYDNIFVVMLENKATSSIRNSAFAPKINAYLNAGNQFTSYFATGNPSEPNYTALGGADDFGITDDSQWNCDSTGANAPQDLPLPTNTQPGLHSSPFAATCTQSVGVAHNIVGRPNIFTALSANGMSWRTYSESMNPGQDFRTDSVTDSGVLAHDDLYPAGTLNHNTTQIGNPNLVLPMPAGLYKTKHHPGMAYQAVRSAAEFKASNRTMGGGQWDQALMNSTAYTVPAGYNVDQLGTDLQSGDIGNINFLMPDQCDDMHGISVTGTASSGSTTASDCSSVANNVAVNTGGNIIARGDNYVDFLVKRIEASPVWANTSKRVAIVLMFDEGNATSGFNSCCGWNPGNSTVAKPLVQNPDGSFSVDNSVHNYTMGNRGHGQSVFVVLTNQPGAPKGVQDSDVYSHFSFVRTLQDMFQLADPDVAGSYMNRSKYTEPFVAANIMNLPEYANSADTHFDAVRPMNHQFVIPAGYVQKQSADRTTPPQVGPDANQVNVWALK